jgi:hypothetical protein
MAKRIAGWLAKHRRPIIPLEPLREPADHIVQRSHARRDEHDAPATADDAVGAALRVERGG